MARSWSVLVIALALAGCAFVPSPAPTCDTAQFTAPPTLSCETAVTAALERSRPTLR